MHLILASSSPRRKELLAQLGFSFEVIPSAAEEIHDHDMPPAELCETNAGIKAADVARLHPDATVIGADTLVFIDDKALGKPRDCDEARDMLRQLSGRTHSVCTGVALVRHGHPTRSFHEITRVTFRDLSEEQISNYLSLVHVLDKAGAYAIQDHGDLIVKGFEGSFENVMGLPIERLRQELPAESDCA